VYCHHDKVIARVRPVHLMNAEQRKVAADTENPSSPPVGCYHPHPPLPVSITHPESILIRTRDDQTTKRCMAPCHVLKWMTVLMVYF